MDTWYGKDIELLTREELIEAVRYLGHQLAEERAPGVSRAKALGKVQMMMERPLLVADAYQS